MKIDSAHIEYDLSTHHYEISLRLSTNDEEGTYTFMISDNDWAKAVERGFGVEGQRTLNEPSPWLVAARKE